MGDYKTNLTQCLQEAVQCFREQYGGEPSIAASAPGRVNLIGEHTDYNDGFVLPMALPMMTVIVGRRSNSPLCTVKSTAVPEDEQCQEFSVPAHPGAGGGVVGIDGPLWIKYVQGVVALMNSGGDVPGFEAVVTSCVPLGGGVSSSASLEVAVGLFVEELLGRELPRKDLALVCQQAEHRYAGNNCGIMDQFISSMADKDCALLIDCEQPLKQDCAQPLPLNDPDLVVLVIDSGARHQLAGGEYNKRRATCESAVRKLGVQKSLRYATMQQLLAGKDKLTDLEFRRARHVISEIQRTEAAAEALREHRYRDFGRLMNESHDSLRDDYEVSCPELNLLVELARTDSDVYGSRMTGGGFGGCTVTLLRNTAVDRVKQHIQESYPKEFTDKKPIFYEASASPGARVITDMLGQ